VLIINAVTETTSKNQPATPDFVWKLVEQYKMNFPQAIDVGQSLHKYAGSGSIGLPFQIGVDLRTMKIVKTKSGKTTAKDIELLAVQTLAAP